MQPILTNQLTKLLFMSLLLDNFSIKHAFLPVTVLVILYYLKTRHVPAEPIKPVKARAITVLSRAKPVLPDVKWDAEQPAKSYPFKDKE